MMTDGTTVLSRPGRAGVTLAVTLVALLTGTAVGATAAPPSPAAVPGTVPGAAVNPVPDADSDLDLDRDLDLDLDGPDLVWRTSVFGQSTDLNFSSNVLPEKVGLNTAVPEVPGTIDGELLLESRGGKLAPGHDGLVFYYVELDPREHNFVLETEMTLDQLGPENGIGPNGQEGAGIMVRDVNGADRQDPMVEGFEEVPAASNLASVVWMRTGLNAMTRTGVTQPWGTVGSVREVQPLTTAAEHQVAPGSGIPVRLRLERTDTELVMSATFTHAGDPVTFSRSLTGADWVQDIDAGSMTVGFFASRNATARFTGSTLTLSPAQTQARPPAPAPETVPALDLLAPATSGTTAYPLRARVTADGTLTVAVDETPVGGPRTVAGGATHVETLDLPEGASTVSVTYTAPGHDPVTRTQAVTVRSLPTELVAAPDGRPENAGTVESPLDLVTAVRYVPPGGTVLLRGGTYSSTRLTITEADSGLADAPKTLRGHPGEQVVLDGEGNQEILIRLDGDHWTVADLELTRAAGNGMRLSGSQNVIRNVVFHANGNSGFQMTGGSDPDRWPADNLVVDCVAYDNKDAAAFNADGFAAKLGVGPGNVFRGNVSHHNIDDGFDLYNRTDEGPNHPITLDGNVAYSNGMLSDGFNAGSGVGTGFKVGGEGLPVDHVLTGNLAFDNQLDGFSDNFNPGRLVLTNNTAIDNLRFNFLVRTNPYVDPADQGVFRANLSLSTRPGSVPAADDALSGDVDATDFLVVDGTTTNGAGVGADAADFASLTAPAGYERTAEGRIVWGDYTRPLAGSPLATAGPDGGHVGALAPLDDARGAFSVLLDLTDETGLAATATFAVAVTLDGVPADPLALTPGGDPAVVPDLPLGTEVVLTAVDPEPVAGARWAPATWLVDGTAADPGPVVLRVTADPAELVLAHALVADVPPDGTGQPERPDQPDRPDEGGPVAGSESPGTGPGGLAVTGAGPAVATGIAAALLLAGWLARAAVRRARATG